MAAGSISKGPGVLPAAVYMGRNKMQQAVIGRRPGKAKPGLFNTID
jgi:hypothetical protein